MAKKNPDWLKEKLNRSSFFFIALFLHVLVLTLVATLIIFQPQILPAPNFAQVLMPPSAPPPTPPPQPQVVSPVPAMPVAPIAPVIVSPNTPNGFTMPPPNLGAMIDLTAPVQVRLSTITAPKPNDMAERLPSIRRMVEKWRKPDNILHSDGDPHNLVATFPIYLAQYADGDWSCNNWKDQTGTITGGCLPNLVHQLGLWSQGNLKVQDVKVIAIDSPELLNDPPPYIFFTGHKDFHLTDAEVTNLQKYLQAGGAVWGDSAFAGDGSRFDVAFHREMKRVLPDKDANFETLPMTHDIFTHSWFNIDKTPTGMNYRADPVEIINLDGKLAVIYTPNDYSDMMTMLLQADAEPPRIDRNSFPPMAPTPAHPLFTPTWFVQSSPFFYRNYEPASAQDCYKLSMNILAHLLIRFDDVLQMAPP